MIILQSPPSLHGAYNRVLIQGEPDPEEEEKGFIIITDGDVSAVPITPSNYITIGREYLYELADFDIRVILQGLMSRRLSTQSITRNPIIGTPFLDDQSVYTDYTIFYKDFDGEFTKEYTATAIKAVAQVGESTDLTSWRGKFLTKLNRFKKYRGYPFDVVTAGLLEPFAVRYTPTSINLMSDTAFTHSGLGAWASLPAVQTDGAIKYVKNGDGYGMMYTFASLAAGTYTISVLAKEGVNPLSRIRIGDTFFPDPLTSEWKRYQKTFTLAAPVTSYDMYFLNYDEALGSRSELISWAQIKLEVGAVSSAVWSPTPDELFFGPLAANIFVIPLNDYSNKIGITPDDIVYNETPIEIMDAPCNPFYARWLNRQGGFDYWMFGVRQFFTRGIESQQTFMPDITDITTATGTEKSYQLTGQEAVRVRAEGLTTNEYESLSKLIYSPQIEWYNEQVGKWITLIVINGGSERDTRATLSEVEFTFKLPTPQVQF